MKNQIELISLSKCKAILQKDGTQYTEEEVIQIREFLYKLAEMDYQIFFKQQLKEQAFENKEEGGDLKQAA